MLSGASPLSNDKARERTRRLIHLAVGLGVLLVPVLGRGACAAIAGAALAYNACLAPALRLDGAYRRPREGHLGGLVTYPLAVLLLLLLMPAGVAAGAWTVLAVADPVASAVGTRWSRPRLPWNGRKSLAGSAAGALAASTACFATLAYMGCGAPLVPALAAGAAGALAESLPLPLDDNLPIAAASGLVLLAWPL